MENKMDGVKISVNNDGDKKPAPTRRGRPKKAVKKEASKPSIAEARSSSQSKEKSSEPKSRSGKKSGPVSILISVFVTAIIVGGSIYAWQNKNVDKVAENLAQDARNVRLDLEQRLEQVKNKLTGVETENEQLKNVAKELEERVALLNDAKKDFSDPELGISFEYPALFGEVRLEMIDGATGKKFKGVFSKNDKLSFGGIAADYTEAATSTVVDFIDSQGYVKKRDKYFFLPLGSRDNEEYELNPTKEISGAVGPMVIVDKNSFVIKAEADGLNVNIGENIGALVNVGNVNFPGISFVNQDLSVLPLESFENILKSIRSDK